MFVLVLTALLFVISFFALGFVEVDYEELRWKLNKKQFLSLLSLIVILFNLFVIIPVNTVGIQYSQFTGTKNETLTEGIHFKSIFDKIYKIPTEVQTKTLENVTGQTKDSQYVNITMDVQYKVNEGTAFQVFSEFRTLDRVDSNLIPNVVQRAVESVTTEYNVYDILGASKNEVYNKIQEALKKELEPKGIQFYYINFADVDAGEAIESAITAQAVAKQAVETAEQEKQKAEIEAQKRVVEAQADLDKAKIEAEIKLVEAQAAADANKMLQQSLNESILRQKWIEKWDGKLPSVISDGQMIYGLEGVNG